ncbi:MAG: YkgJ family cysteine cluster protein [Candidatus Bathyarchaeota archaeon]
MLCSNCGICCEETFMELSADDIKRIEENGFRSEEFTIQNDGLNQLRNNNGYCYFYNQTDNKCKIYEIKPIGCNIYPVVYLENQGVIVDDLCPMRKTISNHELTKKGEILYKLLKIIDNENEIK